MLLSSIALATVLWAAVPGDTKSCAGSAAWGGNCSISNTGSSVEIGATRPGGSGGSGGSRGDGGDAEAAPAPPPPACTDSLCRGNYSVVVLQPTLSDVASFAPASAPFVDEPDGVGIVGMPMNFVATAGVHEQAGTLFDLPVTVRFTPTSYRFIYGDGTSRDSPTGGRTWAALGRAQFSATDTSHAYAARGTYTASATVRYAAQANFGNGWIDVPGLLDIPAGTTTLQIVDVKTALVDKTCLENPRGPGC
ncbi:hypothetical protein HMPREF1529_02920 [Microbacterium sp. oral taxon 186 str. F0373]|uniref:hypothetical protein n=1 Tax=Microbacterium sp. oral taxon 186 TaxID=712383 RepID=UPI00034EC909|nr:hypothetical protein [Microbacterium sp. oral taxon 186]EPD83538.1 hypothetical protein HMPREF1529_02920 [Microbacterium sp. oral taxon 186 str. F0373]